MLTLVHNQFTGSSHLVKHPQYGVIGWIDQYPNGKWYWRAFFGPKPYKIHRAENLSAARKNFAAKLRYWEKKRGW